MNKKAFTLIELLVVTAIIAILASMLLARAESGAEYRQAHHLHRRAQAVQPGGAAVCIEQR